MFWQYVSFFVSLKRSLWWAEKGLWFLKTLGWKQTEKETKLRGYRSISHGKVWFVHVTTFILSSIYQFSKIPLSRSLIIIWVFNWLSCEAKKFSKILSIKTTVLTKLPAVGRKRKMCHTEKRLVKRIRTYTEKNIFLCKSNQKNETLVAEVVFRKFKLIEYSLLLLGADEAFYKCVDDFCLKLISKNQPNFTGEKQIILTNWWKCIKANIAPKRLQKWQSPKKLLIENYKN